MNKDLEKLFRKLDRPPAGPNWVRFIRNDEVQTAKAMLSFIKGQPAFNYQPAYKAIKDRIELGIQLSDARRGAVMGSPAGRTQNVQLVEAFFLHDQKRQYSAQNPVGFEREYFMVSREIQVPVSPLSVIRERGLFVPIFLCGWTINPLTLLQRRLLRTIWEDGFLSLTDYQNSPAEMLFFPKEAATKKRGIEAWSRGDYELLNQSALNEQLEIFLLGRERARSFLVEEFENRPADDVKRPDVDREKDLFK